jgi:hypothetical protein
MIRPLVFVAYEPKPTFQDDAANQSIRVMRFVADEIGIHRVDDAYSFASGQDLNEFHNIVGKILVQLSEVSFQIRTTGSFAP